ncbi:MAG: hypothetical protein H6978_13320, partial [Gammaproteobacteria bacterium]|nr:hypothetical protein [Gammaproteobacteria bacterium]
MATARNRSAVRVGLLGVGTVGSGVITVLQRNADEIARRAGRGIVVTRAAARSLNKARAAQLDGVSLTT